MFETLKRWFIPNSNAKVQGAPPERVRRNAPAMDQPRVPSFFIVGAAKSGTTSLWQYLIQHPNIFMPADIAWKEPSYYCDTYGVKDYDFYLSLFKEAGANQRVGEASTVYLSSPESAGRIHLAIPKAKIIIMLRNPVDRAYSLYKWMHRYGYEPMGAFEAALDAETASRKDNEEFLKGNGHYYWDFLYFHSGLYCEQVKRYYSLFPEDQIKVIIFEEFAEKTLEATLDVYRFLGVDSDFKPEIKIHNEGGPGYGELSKELRQSLERRYSTDVADLSTFLNKDLKTIWFPEN